MGHRKPKLPLTPQSKEEKAKLLSAIPDNARRVKVTDSRGRFKWRGLDELRDDDTIMTKLDGAAIVMTKKPGRRTPASEEEKRLQKKLEAVEDDPLFKITQTAPESPQVLNQVMVGLAREAASLEIERTSREEQNLSTAQVSGKRVTTLKAIGDTWLKWREQVSSDDIDLDSDKFKVLFAFILETFNQSLNEANLRQEQIETVMARLHNLMEGDWSVEARRRMKKRSG